MTTIKLYCPWLITRKLISSPTCALPNLLNFVSKRIYSKKVTSGVIIVTFFYLLVKLFSEKPLNVQFYISVNRYDKKKPEMNSVTRFVISLVQFNKSLLFRLKLMMLLLLTVTAMTSAMAWQLMIPPWMLLQPIRDLHFSGYSAEDQEQQLLPDNNSKRVTVDEGDNKTCSSWVNPRTSTSLDLM